MMRAAILLLVAVALGAGIAFIALVVREFDKPQAAEPARIIERTIERERVVPVPQYVPVYVDRYIERRPVKPRVGLPLKLHPDFK